MELLPTTPKVVTVKMTTASAASGKNVVRMRIFMSRCTVNSQLCLNDSFSSYAWRVQGKLTY